MLSFQILAVLIIVFAFTSFLMYFTKGSEPFKKHSLYGFWHFLRSFACGWAVGSLIVALFIL